MTHDDVHDEAVHDWLDEREQYWEPDEWDTINANEADDYRYEGVDEWYGDE